MLEKIKTLDMSREDWLAERKNSLGGSDIGAILGLNRYRSPYAVWAEKTGRLSEQPDNEAMRQGRDLEAYVARRFVEKSGKNVERCNFLLRDPEAAPYIHANIDRRIIGEKSGLECKTASALSLKNYRGGEFPESYYAQCAAYLAVTGWQRWYLAALALNKAFFIYQITTIKDDPCPEWCESSVYMGSEELDALKRCAADFWENYVIPDEPPPLDGSVSTTDALKEVYGNSAGGSLELFGRESELDRYFQLKQEIEELEEQMETIRQTIMQDMGAFERASCGAYKISWKTQTRNTFNVKKFKKANPSLDLSGFYNVASLRPMKITMEVN